MTHIGGIDLERLASAHHAHFGQPAAALYFCPGRVNLIGEHIDYTGGRVMPGAISRGIAAAISANSEPVIRAASKTLDGSAELVLGGPAPSGDHWTAYPFGVAWMLAREGVAVEGCNLLFDSSLPVGAGLSSSAAIEVLTGFALSPHLHGVRDVSGLKALAVLCQRTENEILGVPCGIMDQFAVALGVHDHVIELDCRTLDFEPLPFISDEHRLVIMDTRKPRQLSASKYNERYDECAAAAEIIRAHKPLVNLSAAEPADLHLIEDPLLKRRATHVVSENRRVRETADALRRHDMRELGRLLSESHQSLRDNYEVTGPELDTIVDVALKVPGCAGARMTGAGFGGCAVALVAVSSLETLYVEVASSYERRFGIMPGLFDVEFTDGVRKLR